MDPWRIGLLVAALAFFALLVAKLRPRLPADEPAPVDTPRGKRAEKRVWARLRKLPRPAQERLLAKLRSELEEHDE